MENVTNFKFKQLLENSGLMISEKFDIMSIFSILTDERKIEIIDKWPIYLNNILRIRDEVESKRRDNLAQALNNINNIVNEAILRKKDEEARKQKETIERREIESYANVYDQMKKANDLQALIRKQHEQ